MQHNNSIFLPVSNHSYTPQVFLNIYS